ncbi:MAG TPA: translation initiation factor IF-2 [Bacteroidia bacterium]|nr:translation initiation factor IF-2 [Bacteroidia bacterium]
MAENNTYRLNKVATELNVGIATIVEHLDKKGFKVENKPTTKIDENMYQLLLTAFQSEKKAKQESKQIVTSFKTKAREEVVAKPATPSKPTPAEEEEDEILIKNTGLGINKATEPVAEKPKAPKPEKTEVPVEPVKEAPVAEAEPIVEKKVEETTSAETPDDSRLEVKVVGKIDLDSLNKKGKGTKKTKTKEEEETPVATPEPKAKKGKAKEVSEEPVAEKTVAPVPVAEPIVTETPAPVAEVVQPPVVVEPVKVAPVEQPVESELVIAKADKLQGLKVMGKIELPVEQPKKKPVASSDNIDGLKKKRKRKQIGFVGGTDSQFKKDDNNKPATPGDNRGGGNNNSNNRPGGQNRPGGYGGGGGHTGGGNRFQKGRPAPANRDTPKEEITDKEIQDKLKETLARLNPGSKPNIGAVRSKIRKQKRDQRAEELELQNENNDAKRIKVTEFVSANELAKMMNVTISEIISACMSLGMMVSINQRLDAETISIVADEFGYEVDFVTAEAVETVEEDEDKPEDLKPRAPIVTVMGHVDHGKTSLLDYIRKANVIAGEAGGITQHIGAYEVTLANGKHVTFLDTPGHEAFTAMRARGAKITDIVIIVIAADDSVMPQTREAISHAQAAAVPIVFAINKIDRDGANPEKIKEQLAGMNILVEDWGGKFQCQEISAKKGLNIEALLEKVLLEAEMLELKANPNKRAVGSVIEATLDKGRGIVTTVMVQAGTLRVGDPILAGIHSGKVKAMFDERGKKMKEAGPSTPVVLLGFDGTPTAGDKFVSTKTEQEAREVANKRTQLQREQGIRTQKHITLDEIGRRLAIGNFKELNLIVKADVDGSMEALSDSLLKLGNDEIHVNVIHRSVGQISESDVLLAAASDAIIIGFNVRPSSQARRLAENESIDVRLYSIIYDAIEEVKSAMEGMLAPKMVEKITCNIEIRDVFKITKVGTIAGCYVTEGKVNRNTQIRLIRDGVVIYTGKLASLKRFKDDVKEVSAGYECGLNIDGYNDIRVGDNLEGYEEVEVKRTL